MELRISKRHLPFAPAIILSASALVLLIVRMIEVGNNRFSFMAWNLLLAWLPLLWAALVVKSIGKQQVLPVRTVIYAVLWVLFLPNSFYLVTDYIHLRNSLPATVLFDAVMLTSFVLAGLTLGYTSTFLMHRELAKRLKRPQVWAVLITVFLLSSVAVYIGRYLGWNSWDALLNPFYIALNLSDRLIYADSMKLTVGVTVLFFGFITATYGAFYSGIKAIRLTK